MLGESRFKLGGQSDVMCQHGAEAAREASGPLSQADRVASASGGRGREQLRVCAMSISRWKPTCYKDGLGWSRWAHQLLLLHS